MKKLKRRIISAITAFAFICSMGINTAQAATRLTTAHLYHWAKISNTTRLTQFQRYINLPDKNNNTALCLAQQAKNRDAYKLLLEFGASTDVECHDDDDPICAIVAGDKVKVSPLGWTVLGAGALIGAYIALDDGDSKTPAPVCLSENGEYSSKQQCENDNPYYTCEKNENRCYVVGGPAPCRTGYSTSYKNETDCGKIGGWIFSTDGKSGEETCGKCEPKTCETGSTTCNPATGFNISSISENGYYAGDDACFTCTYKCNEATHRTYCPDGMSCTEVTFEGVTCQTNPVCKEGYNFNNETDCKAGGYICTESAPGSGCWKQTDSEQCPPDYTEGLKNCSGQTYPEGWIYESQPVGFNTCGKCTPKQCPLNSSTDTCDDFEFTNPTTKIVGYNGNNPCYTCTYACDETANHYTQPNTCETKHTGFNCKQTTVDPQTTCFIADTCEDGYLSSCNGGSFYTATVAQSYSNPITEATCNTCEYSCDTANGWSTTRPTEGVIFEQIMPNDVKCYTSTACPTDYPYTKEFCEANGHVCATAPTVSYNCYKPISCPTDYEEGKESCNNTSGWTYHSKNLDSFVCGYCEQKNCPTGETTQCSPEDEGARLTQTPTDNYKGDTRCNTCSYACDESTAYSDRSVCESNDNYKCSEIHPNDLTCWKRISDGDCPTGSSETPCSAEEGYTFTQTEQTIGDSKKCYTCNYTCDTTNGWSTTEPHAGHDKDDVKMPNNTVCYLDKGCPTGTYTEQSICEQANLGYTCIENISGSGCWKKDIPADCEDEYSTAYQTVSNCGIEGGWEFEENGKSGDLICGKCTPKQCNTDYTAGLVVTDCGSSASNGWTTIQDPTQPYSGEQECRKCEKLPCNAGSSIEYQDFSKCPTTTGLEAVDSSFSNNHGDDGCYKCQYQCDTDNGYYTQNACEQIKGEGQICVPTTLTSIFGDSLTCYQPTSCPTDAPYSNITTCQNQGHTCTESSTEGCYKPVSCPIDFEQNRTDCLDKTHYEGWDFKANNIEGLITCGKCTAKTCSDSSTTCTPAETGYTLTPTENGTYAGNDACLTCTYTCNEEDHFDTCPPGKDCTTDTKHGVTCQINPVCKEGYNYPDEATCEADGYVCSESAPGSGCWKQDNPASCSDGYSTAYPDVASCGQEGGWEFTPNGKSGGLVCGKCDAKQCPTNQTTSCPNSNTTGITLTNSTQTGNYNGQNTCYTCSYGCQTEDGYETNTGSCRVDTGFKVANKLISNYDNQYGEDVSCQKCVYSCDDTNNYITAEAKTPGRAYEEYTSTLTAFNCYKDVGCPTGTYTEQSICEQANLGYNCIENITGSGCWKKDIPTTCPEGTEILSQCPAPQNGFTANHTQTDSYSAGEQCYTCGYECDNNAGYYDNEPACLANNIGYTCTTATQTGSDGSVKTCWYNSTNVSLCPTDTYTKCEEKPIEGIIFDSSTGTGNFSGADECLICNYKCDTTNGYQAEACTYGEGYTTSPLRDPPTYDNGQGIITTCRTCTYLCNIYKGYSSTKPTSGGYSSIQMPNGTYCYKQEQCATGEFETEAACLNNFGTCEESPDTKGCWRPTSCLEGYEAGLTSCSLDHPEGWTYEVSSPNRYLTCGKCTAKQCNSGYSTEIKEAANCGSSASNGWTTIQDPHTPYAGDNKCNACVAKTCPAGTTLGSCPTSDFLDGSASNSGAWSGNEECTKCSYSCYETKITFANKATCDYATSTDCLLENFTTPLGETIKCYIPNDYEPIADMIVRYSQGPLSGGDSTVYIGDPNSPATIVTITNNGNYYGIKTDSGSVINTVGGVINVSNVTYGIGIETLDGNVTNQGEINVSAIKAQGINSKGNFINNNGIIDVTSDYGEAEGILALNAILIENTGSITATSTQGGRAYGINSTNSNIENSGTITATSTNGYAYGIFSSGGYVKNSGTITASGKNAYGIYASGAGNIIVNEKSGTINANGTSNAYGIYFDTGDSTNVVANYGTIIVNGTNVGDAGIHLNGGTLANAGDVTFQTEVANLDDLGGTITLEDGGTYEAKTLKGNLTAGTSLVTGSNLDTYVAEDSLKVDNTDELNLTSGSAMFEATIEENATTGNKNVVMTRSSFNTFAPNNSIANYLEENYQANKLVDMFDNMKAQTSNTATSEAIAKELGYDIMPNFADENFTVLKSLNRNISETILTPTNEVNRVTAGYDNINIETKDKGLLSGSDLSSNTMYTFGDKRLDNKNRLGLGLSFTKISSNYEKGGNRDLEIVSIFMPYMHKFSEKLRLSSILSFGMGFGEYDRGSSEYESDINDIFYGITNELRYSMDLNGFAELEPALMLNAIGYTEDGFDEGNGEKALESQKTHNLSVEAGIGLFLKKQFNTPQHGRFTMRVGGAYYRELASPFDDIKARHKSDTGAWYRINDYADLYDEDRALLEATLNYDYKALGLYLKYNRLFQRNAPQLLDLGVKYNF